jgi:nucleoside-triphosphatase THEP1
MERMQKTDVLVIDETSMMENLAFERLNQAMKKMRKTDNQPFGGVQMSNSRVQHALWLQHIKHRVSRHYIAKR